ncbi:hypothetical protein ACEQ8H_006025 [Pleosporales sp. CAS-2024a]
MAGDGEAINLRILSPSPDVDGGLTFADLPAATTVQELRRRIQAAVPSRPAPDRMRLIYRGRVVANDGDTLASVFGADEIRENKDQSLHLVLRELPPPTTTAAAAAAAAAAAPSPPLQTNPFRAIPQARPHPQPHVAPPPPPPPPPQPHLHHHLVAGPPNPFQIPLPPVVQQQLAHTLAMAQNAQLNHAPPPPPQQQSGGAPAPENAPGRAVRQEGIGPNGERWSLTYSTQTIPGIPPIPPQPVLVRPFMPPAFGLPPRPAGSPAPAEAIDRLLPRMRLILESARQEMDNVRILLQTAAAPSVQPAPLASPNPPPWRLERIRLHMQAMGQNLNLVERGLGVIVADASMTNNPDVVALRQSATELRGQLEHLSTTMGTSSMGAQPSASTSTPTLPALAQPAAQPASPTVPSEAPQELFLLSSPQGPVALLFDQRGTYMTAPIVPTLPFQTFTSQFAQNRQFIAGLGQHLAQSSQAYAQNAQNSTPSQTQLGGSQPTPTPTQPPPATHDQAQNQAQAQAQAQAHQQGQAPHQAAEQAPPAVHAPNPPVDNDRLGNIAGHVWLVFKLACFVYFFSGTGWYKSIFLGLIVAGVYLAQLGIFEGQFRVIRQHFEAMLPVGALAERVAQPAAEPPRRNMTPEEAARRILQQQRDERASWFRDSLRTVERSFAIFVASLWPGIGERMVHAQEERVRAERVAEEERQRAAEEEQKKREEEEEAQQQQKEVEKGEASVAAEQAAEGSSAKGKERAEVAPVEGS